MLKTRYQPFPRILCAVGEDHADTAIAQALVLTGEDGELTFAAGWQGQSTPEVAAVPHEHAVVAVEEALIRARHAGVDAATHVFQAWRFADALLAEHGRFDLVVTGAHGHSRLSGIVLGETTTELVHRAKLPVLVAREKSLDAGVIVATRAVPSDRRALIAAAHIAARLGTELIVAHIADRDDDARRAELRAELANARALLGREVDYLELEGSPALAIVDLAADEGAGLVVLGSDQRHGIDALRSVSERVAHAAPCSVLVMRG